MKKIIALTLICLSFAIGRGWAQSDTTLVAKNLELARRLMDEGLYDESIALLDDADAFDATRTALWPYEKAFANYLKGDYREAVRLLRRAVRFRDASQSAFRMLGDCYLLTGQPDMALEACLAGLQKFPDSGQLYYGVGTVHLGDEEYGLALDCFLEGTEREAAYAPNWAVAAAIQLLFEETIFGVINAETALCIDSGAELSEVMSEALTKFWSDPSPLTVSEVGEPPFTAAWRETFIAAVRGIGINADAPGNSSRFRELVRRRFIEVWFSKGLNETWPCALFDYHRALIEAGHFEAYNYRLFSQADPAAFAAWRLMNGEAFEAFEKWAGQNPIFEP